MQKYVNITEVRFPKTIISAKSPIESKYMIRSTQNIFIHFSILLVTFLSVTNTSSAQVIADKYGQNRLQFEQKKWFRYLSPNFAISYAENDEKLARFVLPVAEEHYRELTKLFEHQLRKQIELIVYSDYSDYEQSNIGVETHIVNQGGVTTLQNPKIRVYFNGNHNDLIRQIREGLAKVLLGKILSGTNLQEIVQNSVLMNLPKWFVQGAIAYATEDWNTDLDNRLKDVLLQGKYNHFLEFARKEPQLAGHSLFHFISKEHGSNTVSNLLYLTRINRSVENGFLYVFGKTFYQVAGAFWFNYYSEKYNADNTKRRFPSKGKINATLKKGATLSHVKISPDSKKVVYVENYFGRRKVYLYDLETDRAEVVYATGEKDVSGDFEANYPLIGWGDNNTLIIIDESRDKIRIRYQELNGSKKATVKKINEIERVVSFDINDKNDLVLVGINNGQSDLYRFNNGRLTAITSDFWDENEAVFARVKGQIGVIFSSNRPRPYLNAMRKVNEMPMQYNDLFFYNLKTRSKELIRLTETPLAEEKSPLNLDNGKFSYLSDISGIFNRYVSQVDSVLVGYERVLVLEDGTIRTIEQDSYYQDLAHDTTYLQPIWTETGVAYANTDYSRNILEHHGNGEKSVDLIFRDATYQVFVRDARYDREMDEVMPTVFRISTDKRLQKLIKKAKDTAKSEPRPEGNVVREHSSLPKKLDLENDTIPPTKKDTGNIDIDNYEFQSEFEDVKEPTINEDGTNDVTTPIVLVEEEGNIKARKKAKKRLSLTDTENTKVVEWDRKSNRPYKSLFKVDQLTIQFDNTPMYNGMDMYLGGNYQFQPLAATAKVGFEDIHENFYLQVGMRLPVSFNGLEYFIDIENKKGMIDQRYSFYRRGRVENYVVTDTVNNISIEARGRNVKHLIETELKYPISKFQSVRGIFGAQLEKVAILSEDILSLQVPVYHENRLRARLEYVFDNTIGIRHNARKGLLFKGYLDLYKPFQVSTDEKFELNFNGGLTTAIGFDGRYFHTFDDKAIFAFRLAGASSFGQQKILYSLGGVENWIFPTTSTTIPLPNSDGYGLQTLAANLRGFTNNARNGSSYMLSNFELRIPIVDYLSKNPPRNAMLRSLQFTFFFDIGTAWQGLSPFSTDNPLNTTVIDNSGPNSVSPVKVTVNYYRRPILFGYGFGIRTVLLGHYFRLDYAWGVETGQVQKPMLYLSIGTDF